MRRLATTVLAALAAVAVAATPAAAKPVQNTQFTIATSQGLGGIMTYFSKHEIEGRRYVFAQIQVRVTCGLDPADATTGTFFLDGNLRKRDNDQRFELTEVTPPGLTSTKTMTVTLLPKIKGGKGKKSRPWKRAKGSLSFDATDGLSTCSSGPVFFSSASAGGF
jgi:hypothetical protein